MKAEGGLTKTALLRMTPEMHEAIEEAAKRRSKAEGRVVSAADLQREWIAEGLAREASRARDSDGDE